MLDQRGTGNSTPYGAPGSPSDDASRLRHYRADAIVRDAEAFRAHLGADSGACSASRSAASARCTT